MSPLSLPLPERSERDEERACDDLVRMLGGKEAVVQRSPPHKFMGTRGIPDRRYRLFQVAFDFEVKKAGGELSDYQVDYLRAERACGCLAACGTLQDLLRCVEWLRDDLGIIDTADQSAAVAADCEDTGDVWFVPALLGLGAPVWDFGARGTFLGITRGTGRPEMVRAVLEGVADRGADLLEAAETDSGLPIESLRVDGGMSANDVFVQALADACGRPIEISPVLEATTLGAAYLAGMAVGIWADEEDVADAWSPRRVVEPSLTDEEQAARRERWLRARGRSEATIPELSALDF